MIFRFFKCFIYDTALKWCSNIQPRSTSLPLRRSRREFPHWTSPDLPDIPGPCTGSRHSLGFQHPQLLNNPCSELPLHTANTEGHCRDLFINTTRPSLGLVQSRSDTRTCSFQYTCLKKASESITGLATSKQLPQLSSPSVEWKWNSWEILYESRSWGKLSHLYKQRWIRKLLFFLAFTKAINSAPLSLKSPAWKKRFY